MKIFFDEADFPGGVRQAQVLEVVGAVDVDEVELAVFAGIALCDEPRVEDEVVLFEIAAQVAPDDEGFAAFGRAVGNIAFDRAEPPSPLFFLPEPARKPKTPFTVALEGGTKSARRGICSTVSPMSQLKVSMRSTFAKCFRRNRNASP